MFSERLAEVIGIIQVFLFELFFYNYNRVLN